MKHFYFLFCAFYFLFLNKIQAQKISGGGVHSLLVCYDSSGLAFGGNYVGQLGIGNLIDQWTPVTVSGLGSLKSVSAGEAHSAAVKQNGTVWAWGTNFLGQLGDSTTTDRLSPVPILALSGIKTVACGGYHTLFLKTDSSAWGTGNNFYGQLGDSTGVNTNKPVIAEITGVTAISAGYVHSLYIRKDSVFASGRSEFGQIGDSAYTDRLAPVRIKAISGVVAVSAGYAHSLALKSDGTVWGWGHNLYGQCGDGVPGITPYPVQAAGLTGIVAISAGGFHSLALKSDGTVWGWGYNGDGTLGIGYEPAVPVMIPSLSGVTEIAAGMYHSMFLKSDGTLWTCGDNIYGGLGDGSPTDRIFPVTALTGSCLSFPLTQNAKPLFGYIENCKAALQWGGNANPDNVYVIQYSPDGNNYTDIGQFTNIKNDAVCKFVTDIKGELSYYRIKNIFPNTEMKYSNVINLRNNCLNTAYAFCYPNPATEKVNIHFNAEESGMMKFNVYNITGEKILYTEKYFVSGNHTEQINISGFAKGIYFIEIKQESGISEMIKIVKSL